MAAKGLGPQPPQGNKAAPAGKSRAPSAKAGAKTAAKTGMPRSRPQVIPDVVANRMARRIAVASGVPSVLGMAVFVASYLLVSRHVMDVPPGLTLVVSGAFFLLGVLGLSYGVLSASWEAEPGSLLGSEQIGVNIGRLRQSLRALRSGG
ncbi:MAG: DUF3464 family protein [Cyanobacteria bacterium M_surface_7_m2_040]|nr:DUF3464 family protein [Cyanobacteria bacterium K_Offshore_0m_m2_072]MBM5828544.1 DUF3464 family protein [Cyanobacteria bacterium M_surface_7_m2_040]